jgi:hypothetical protein
MEWSSTNKAGFVLAALLCDDRELAAVEHHTSPELLAGLRAESEKISQNPGAKAQALRDLIARMRPAPDPRRLPVRARALLAPHLPRELGCMYVEGAPQARPGYEVDAALVSELERLARAGVGSPS